MELHELSLSRAADMLASRQVSALELCQAVIKRRQETDPVLNCYITATPELALEQAAQADRQLKSGQATPLTGIPLGLKDSICTQGITTTAGSRTLYNFVPPYDATIVHLLKKAGMVLTGKHNLDDFAMGSTTESSYFGTSRNPWDTKAFPGGSSGGTAAAVAAGSCLGALGSDTGGSIRQPASHCGVVGLKPTYGLVSRFGVISFASSLDQAGPIGRSVQDVAMLLQAIAGYDPKDQTSVPTTLPDYAAACAQPVKGMKLGLPQEYFIEGLDSEVEKAVKNAVNVLAGLGVEVVPISLPHTKYLISTYYIIATAEASSNLARFDGIKYGFHAQGAGQSLEELYLESRSQGFGPEVMRRIMLGTYVLSSGYYDAYYAKASQVRTLIKDDFNLAWQKVDAIAAPVAPHAALDLGCSEGDPLTVYLRDIFTISCNLSGLPAISLPAGLNSQGRPIGLQLMAPRMAETTLLALGGAFQRETDFHNARPRLNLQAGGLARKLVWPAY